MSSGVSMHAMTRNVPPHATVFDVDLQDALELLHLAQGRGTQHMRLPGGMVDRVGDDAVAVLEVRGEHAVVSGEMGARAARRGTAVTEGETVARVHPVENGFGSAETLQVPRDGIIVSQRTATRCSRW